MSKVKSYLSLIRFSHTIFAMPFAMIGFALGVLNRPDVFGVGQWNLHRTIGWGYSPREELVVGNGTRGDIFRLFVLVVLCMIFARSAAMAFNRWLDVEFDAKNPRTAIREIPRGIISKSNALRFVIFSCLAFIVCTWFINPLCFWLSFIALAVM